MTTSPWSLYETVIRVGELAQRQPCGPVYLNVPVEHMVHEWMPPTQMRRVPPAPKAQPMPADIEALAERLARATNPVIETQSAGKDPARRGAARCIRRASRHARGRGLLDHPCQLSQGPSAASGHEFRAHRQGRRRRVSSPRAIPWYPPRNRPAGAFIASIGETPDQGTLGLPASSCRHVSRSRHCDDAGLLVAALKARGVTADTSAPGATCRARAHEGSSSLIACRRGRQDERCGRSIRWRLSRRCAA